MRRIGTRALIEAFELRDTRPEPESSRRLAWLLIAGLGGAAIITIITQAVCG